VTVGPGSEKAPLYLGRQAVTLAELAEQLTKLKQDERMARAIVLLKTDVRTSVGMERKVSELVLGAGFRLALVGEPENHNEGGEPSEAAPQ
jgi:biopolymer transport protein ExbD